MTSKGVYRTGYSISNSLPIGNIVNSNLITVLQNCLHFSVKKKEKKKDRNNRSSDDSELKLVFFDTVHLNRAVQGKRVLNGPPQPIFKTLTFVTSIINSEGLVKMVTAGQTVRSVVAKATVSRDPGANTSLHYFPEWSLMPLWSDGHTELRTAQI